MKVRTRSDCTWDSRPGAAWLSITAGGNATGDGEVRYRVAPNSSTEERSGTLSVAGQTFTVRQRGAEPPRTEDVEVEGRVGGVGGSCPNITMSLSGQSVTTDSDTKFKHGECGDIRSGVTVKVKGRRTGSGPVVAREVEINR